MSSSLLDDRVAILCNYEKEIFQVTPHLTVLYARSVLEIKRRRNVNFRPQTTFCQMLLKNGGHMYTYFSHQNDVPCFHVQECFGYFCLFLLSQRIMTQYICAQGKELEYLFVFNLVRIPHWNSPPQPPPTPLLVRYCTITPASSQCYALHAQHRKKKNQNQLLSKKLHTASHHTASILWRFKLGSDFITCWVSRFNFCASAYFLWPIFHWSSPPPVDEFSVLPALTWDDCVAVGMIDSIFISATTWHDAHKNYQKEKKKENRLCCVLSTTVGNSSSWKINISHSLYGIMAIHMENGKN